jgi:hypothetical protein
MRNEQVVHQILTGYDSRPWQEFQPEMDGIYEFLTQGPGNLEERIKLILKLVVTGEKHEVILIDRLVGRVVTAVVEAVAFASDHPVQVPVLVYHALQNREVRMTTEDSLRRSNDFYIILALVRLANCKWGPHMPFINLREWLDFDSNMQLLLYKAFTSGIRCFRSSPVPDGDGLSKALKMYVEQADGLKSLQKDYRRWEGLLQIVFQMRKYSRFGATGAPELDDLAVMEKSFENELLNQIFFKMAVFLDSDWKVHALPEPHSFPDPKFVG